MKELSNNIKVLVLLLFILVSVSTTLYAQGPDENSDDPPASDVPIDGGLSLLLAAGVAYGAKKGYDQHKKKKQAEPPSEGSLDK